MAKDLLAVLQSLPEGRFYTCVGSVALVSYTVSRGLVTPYVEVTEDPSVRMLELARFPGTFQICSLDQTGATVVGYELPATSRWECLEDMYFTLDLPGPLPSSQFVISRVALAIKRGAPFTAPALSRLDTVLYQRDLAAYATVRGLFNVKEGRMRQHLH